MTDMPASPFQFPCDFPIKVIGNHTPTFKQAILQLTQKHFSQFSEKNLKAKSSKNNNFLSLSLTVHALDKETLDALYKDLSAHPDCKMVL